jgi:pimeloyl-ACP methyl ester carboxylesterase
MGGFVAQQIAVDRPELVRRLILVGTGPRGGEGMDQLAPDVAPLFGKVYDPQDLMWLAILFSPSEASQAAGRRFLERIRARTEDRDVPVSEATVAAHSAAAGEWGVAAPGSYDYLKGIPHPALVVNGSNDIVIPTVNSYILQQNLPKAELILFPDSSHGSHNPAPLAGRCRRHAVPRAGGSAQTSSCHRSAAAARGSSAARCHAAPKSHA